MTLINFFLFFTLSLGHGQQNAVTTDASTAAPPRYVLSYDALNYSLEGSQAANTNIYQFGSANINVHLLGATWLASPRWTFVALVPYLETTIETIYEPTSAGANLKLRDQVSGLGDLRVMAISPLWTNGKHTWTYDLGGTAPTGSVDKYFSSVPTQRASYNMQTGSGTVDMIAGLTYTYAPRADWISTLRGQGTARLGRNNNDYSLGDDLQLRASTGYQWGPYFHLGGLFNYRLRAPVSGRDGKYELFNNYASPTDPSIQGNGHQFYRGTQINWDLNAVTKVTIPFQKNVIAAMELGLPITQKFVNRDDVDLNVNYWVSGSLKTLF